MSSGGLIPFHCSLCGVKLHDKIKINHIGRRFCKKCKVPEFKVPTFTHCNFCGLELGEDEKVKGFAMHETCFNKMADINSGGFRHANYR